MKTLRFKTLFMALALTLTVRESFAADTVASAKIFMTQLIDLSKHSREKQGVASDESTRQVKDLSAKIDFQALAKKTLGKRWNGYSAADRREFMATLQELLEVVVYPKAQKITAKSDDVKFEKVAGQPSNVKAVAEIEREKKGDIVTEKLEVVLSFDPAGAKIVDAEIEGELISANLKRQFDEALKKKTFRNIIDQMKKRVDESKKKS